MVIYSYPHLAFLLVTMTYNFLPNASDSNLPQLNLQSREPAPSDREPLKHLLIGSPKAVISTIHSLQILCYASVGDWSPLLPTANPGEVMSILSRYILVQ